MKSIKHFTMLLVIALMATACEKPAPEKPGEGDEKGEAELPEMTALFESPVNVDSEKQDLTLEFRIEHPVEGAKMKAKAQCDWMTLKVEGSSVIASVDANRYLDARDTEINVTYQYGKDSTEMLTATVPVTQAVMEGIRDISFKIEFVDDTNYTITADVTPSDDEIFYVCMAADKAAYDSMGSDEAWVKSEFAFLKMSAEASGMTLLDMLDRVGGKGYQRISIGGIPAGYPAYFYVYGITYEGNPKLITKVYKEIFMVTE